MPLPVDACLPQRTNEPIVPKWGAGVLLGALALTPPPAVVSHAHPNLPGQEMSCAPGLLPRTVALWRSDPPARSEIDVALLPEDRTRTAALAGALDSGGICPASAPDERWEQSKKLDLNAVTCKRTLIIYLLDRRRSLAAGLLTPTADRPLRSATKWPYGVRGRVGKQQSAKLPDCQTAHMRAQSSKHYSPRVYVACLPGASCTL